MSFLTTNTKKIVKNNFRETIKYTIYTILGTLLIYLLGNVGLFFSSGQFQMIPLSMLFLFSFTGFFIIGSFGEGVEVTSNISNSIRYGITRKEYMVAAFIDILCFNVLALIILPILANIAGFYISTLAISISLMMWFVFLGIVSIGLFFVRFNWVVAVAIIVFWNFISRIISFNDTWNGIFNFNLVTELPRIDDPYFDLYGVSYFFEELSLFFQGILSNVSPLMIASIPLFFGVSWLLYRDLPVKIK